MFKMYIVMVRKRPLRLTPFRLTVLCDNFHEYTKYNELFLLLIMTKPEYLWVWDNDSQTISSCIPLQEQDFWRPTYVLFTQCGEML